ncbi:MAG: hypothetical protein LRZ88_04520, partial [Candidatus Cloacimonetes bacterium]|nr:hypothetical protein [Candidatus Cloacimonadota bacterium]
LEDYPHSFIQLIIKEIGFAMEFRLVHEAIDLLLLKQFITEKKSVFQFTFSLIIKLLFIVFQQCVNITGR